MKLIKKISIYSLALFSLITTSCLDDSATNYGEGPLVVQFPSSKKTKNFLQDGSGKVYDFAFKIEYFGKTGETINEDVTVTLAVNEKLSTAKEGVEFFIPNNKFVIPAGKNYTDIVIKVNSKNLDSSNPKTVALEIIDSTDNVNISSNKNTAELTLQAICPSNLAGTYVYSTGKKKEVTIKETGTGTYEISADDAFKGSYPIKISDVCDNITITGGYIQDNFGYPVSGSGKVNEDGSITINYTVDTFFTNREMILKKK